MSMQRQTEKRQNTHLAQCIKDVIVVDQHLSFGHFRDVIKTFGGEVSDPVFGVHKASQKRSDEFLHIGSNIYSQGYSCSSKSDESSIPYMKRVGSIVEHFDELVNNLADPFLLSLLVTFSYLPIKECIRSRRHLGDRYPTSQALKLLPSVSRRSCLLAAWQSQNLC